MQLGNDADDLAAEDFDALMLLVIEQDFARDFAERGMLFHPMAAANVGAREVNPDKALRVVEGGIDRLGRQRTRPALGIEMEGGEDA